MLQEKMPCESYQFTIQTLRVKCLRVIGSWKRNYTKNTPKNMMHTLQCEPFSEVWQIRKCGCLKSGPSNRYYHKMNQMYSNVWYLISLRHCHDSRDLFLPGHRLGHLRQLCATLYGWHWCTLCHQGLACGGVKWRLSCGLGKSNYKCNVTATFQRIN